MKILKYIILSLFVLLIASPSFSQKQEFKESDYNNYEVEMADKLREDGKIYVVVAVLTTILAGLIVYTITIDRKISNLERLIDRNTQK
jgi:hypothetical protein